MLFLHCLEPQNDWNLVQPPCPRQPVPVLSYSQSKKSVSWYSEGASCVAVCAHCLWAPLKRDVLHLLCVFPSGFFAYFDKVLKNLLQAEQAQLSVFPSHVRCSSPLITFVALCWTLSTMSISLFCWGGQNWTQQSRHGLTCAEQRGRISWPAGNTPAQAACELVLFAARTYWVALLCSTWCPPGPFL